MEQTKHTHENTESPARSVRVWDLPTRLFHWLLVILVITSYVTGNIGGNAMQYHEWSGFAILALLMFRLVWGFVGSRESRFATFVYGPPAVISYARILLRRSSVHYLGHNPLGGWSIIALLFTLLVQAATGLFTSNHRARMHPRCGGTLLLLLQAPKSGITDDHRCQAMAWCGGRTRRRPHLVGGADCRTGRPGCLSSCTLGHRPKIGPSAREATLST